MPKKSRRKLPDSNKVEIWYAYMASGGRIGEVASRYDLSVEEVEKIVNEVQEFFHAPINDPEVLLRQFSLLNDVAAQGEYILYEISQYYYRKWKEQGSEEEPPAQLVDVVTRWHALVMDRLKLQARFIKDMQKTLAVIQQQQAEEQMFQQLFVDDEEEDDNEA